MSDKRTTYTIGAIVAAFVLVFGLVAGSTSLTTMSVSSVDPMQMSGHVIITLADPDGNIIAYRQTDNIVTHAGKDCSADLLFGTSTALCTSNGVFKFIAIGSGFTSLTESDAALETEITLTAGRQGTLISEVGATVTGPAVKTFEGVFTLGDTQTVDEVGLFDAATSGNMFSRLAILPSITANVNDVITITYVLKVG